MGLLSYWVIGLVGLVELLFCLGSEVFDKAGIELGYHKGKKLITKTRKDENTKWYGI